MYKFTSGLFAGVVIGMTVAVAAAARTKYGKIAVREAVREMAYDITDRVLYDEREERRRERLIQHGVTRYDQRRR